MIEIKTTKNQPEQKNPKEFGRLKERGQLSMFLGVSLMVVICLIAFVINVGLFVRAKINLQNAVDAAAYAGAATQARLLSQIGYVNWEMRNNFKEWLFKYYVLGQLGNPVVLAQAAGGAGATNFRAEPFQVNSGAIGYQDKAFDPFNMPSVCIHPGSTTNICSKANVPGIPRFNTVGLPAISEKHEEFLNTVTAEKAKDCSRRTDLNFGTAMIWTYGPGGGQAGVVNQGFEIAADRPGVWPKAMELAFRIRNLEMLVNRPPVESICDTGCTANLSTLNPGSPLDERPIKAFMSARRNLDGGDSNEHQDLKYSFKLNELPPSIVDYPENSLSGYLIPTTFEYTVVGAMGKRALSKSYLDLQLLPVNYSIFFTAFVSKTGTIAQVTSEADCFSSKTAIPVPGLPVGFVKNPRILTYYAVKGEAKYIGMFYPFQSSGITLTAYAAAKPMGGRIGPRLFYTKDKSISGRQDTPVSAAYTLGMMVPGGWIEGRPIPASPSYFVQNAGDTVGGIPDSNETAKYSLPNLIYDYFPTGMEVHLQAGQYLAMLKEWTGPASQWAGQGNGPDTLTPPPNEHQKGLLSRDQFAAFFNNLQLSGGGITAADALRGIYAVRRPTKYEAMNYLVPTYYPPGSDFEAPSVILGAPTPEPGGSSSPVPIINYMLFAPLYGPGWLYTNTVDLSKKVREHVTNSEKSVETYLQGLKEVADIVRGTATHGSNTAADGNTLSEAGDLIYPPNIGTTPSAHTSVINANSATCEKVPMATKFAYFFQGSADATVCGITPIAKNFETYFTTVASNGGDMYLQSQYSLPEDGSTSNDPTGVPGKYMTGFMPGDRQGADESTSQIRHPFTSDLEAVAKRNYYSVKLIAIKNLKNETGFFKSGFQVFLENNASIGAMVTPVYGSDGVDKVNYLDTSQLSLFGTTLDY